MISITLCLGLDGELVPQPLISLSTPLFHDWDPCSHLPRLLHVQDVLILLSEQANPDAPRVLASATEACVYHAPTTNFASSTWRR